MMATTQNGSDDSASCKSHRRVRGQNFSIAEKEAAKSLIEVYRTIIECKRMDSETAKLKDDTWALLAEQYNTLPFVSQRTAKQLRLWWDNQKKRRSRAIGREIRLLDTDGIQLVSKSNETGIERRTSMSVTAKNDSQPLLNASDSNHSADYCCQYYPKPAGNALTRLNSQLVILKSTKRKVIKAKEDRFANEASDLMNISAAFAELRRILNDTERRVLKEVRDEYRQNYEMKSAEFDDIEKLLRNKIRLVKELQDVDVLTNVPQVKVNISLDELKSVGKAIREIRVITTDKHPAPVQDSDQPCWIAKKKKLDECLNMSPPSAGSASFPCSPLTDHSGQATAIERSDTVSSSPTDKLRNSANVRAYITCTSCNKPRCIYSANELSAKQKNDLTKWKESGTYKCGDGVPGWISSLTADPETVLEDDVTCTADISEHYYSRMNTLPAVLRSSDGGDSSRVQTADMKGEQYTYILECWDG